MARLLNRMGWEVRIQPFHGYGSTRRIRVMAKLLYASPTTDPDYHNQPVHDMRTMAVRGFRNFTSQIAPFAPVTITAGGRVFKVHADRSGIVDVMLEVSLEPGTAQVDITTEIGDSVTTEVTVFDPEERLGVVSDIDDTVMVTMLPRPLIAFWNAFILHQTSRQVVPGMPMLYQKIAEAHPATPFVYLSTGAWNVYPVLRRFLYKNGYPAGPILLTDWGPTNTGFFRSGAEHKKQTLRRLAERFPEMRWLLIGDDGQHDPQIYGDFARAYPRHVEGVAIRRLTAREQVLAHFSFTPLEQGRLPLAPRDVPHVAAPDGHGLADALRRVGTLPS
ncbi:App1 family protein [Devriesea agamarum]|uniref:App1 family protein n=1 Tax=Devriesea agamarum TaxID=472569 RepID=UPI000A56AA25|nr:phosphatase domain-containing protein [Devriesea agamarum]